MGIFTVRNAYYLEVERKTMALGEGSTTSRQQSPEIFMALLDTKLYQSLLVESMPRDTTHER
jgi:hypothetical protein